MCEPAVLHRHARNVAESGGWALTATIQRLETSHEFEKRLKEVKTMVTMLSRFYVAAFTFGAVPTATKSSAGFVSASARINLGGRR